MRMCCCYLQGTTTNGRYLLPFKTGAFLAGVPVLPTIIHYYTSSGSNDLCCSSAARVLAAAAVAAAAAAAAGLAVSSGASSGAAAAAGLAAAGVAAVLGGSALMGVGGVSPTWESIDATRHLLLMMCQPFHTVTCYEVSLQLCQILVRGGCGDCVAAALKPACLCHSSSFATAAYVIGIFQAAC
jgi:hypothetical protein